jgi:hypothetical protein
VWENEQLACIDDYLSMTVILGRTFFTPLLNHRSNWIKLAATDVVEKELDGPEWEYDRREHYWHVSCELTQHLLTFGLEKLHRLAVADTYEAKRKLVYPHIHKWNGSFL